MPVSIDRVWSMEVPAEWETALRVFSPISTTVPWLSIRWFPMRRQRFGKVVDAGRWILHDCHHESSIDPEVNDIVSLLKAERPSSIKDVARQKIRKMYVSDYQWEMYRKHRVWAKEFWVIQGEHGGHPTEYERHEEKWLEAMGLPTNPPALGALPYAPLDARVFTELRRRNRLIKLGGIDALKRANTPEAIQREFDDAERIFREQHYTMMESAMAASADFIDYYTKSSKTATECRETLPQMSVGAQNAAHEARDVYIETGQLPQVERTQSAA